MLLFGVKNHVNVTALNHDRDDDMKRFIPLIFTITLMPLSLVCHAEETTTIELKKEIRDIALGMHVTELPAGRYKDFTCVDPDKALETLNDFEECPVDNLNLYEVRLKYDTSDNEWEAVNDRFKGTRISGHPVILSILVDNKGAIQGIRAYTDPDASPFTKKQAYLLSDNIKRHYGNTDWKCVEKPPGESGNKPISSIYIDRMCNKIIDGKRIRIGAKVYRALNQKGKEYTNSSTFEIISLMALSNAS